jgi:hypothetical protein
MYQKACAQAARTCEAALHRALVTAITMNRSGETRKLTIILTAMQQPMYHPVVATTFTIRSAQHAWQEYMVSLAEARANYLIQRNRLRQRFLTALKKQALTEAIDSGNVTDALLIHQTILRLNREIWNPLTFPGTEQP